MNKLIQLIIISIILAGCQKDEAISPFVWPYWGEASALKNGVIWKPKVIGIVDNDNIGRYNLVFDLYNNKDFLRNNLTIHGLNRGIIKLFSINSDSVPQPISSLFATIIEDGDVLGDVFNLDKAKDNFVEITELNGDEIKGKFNITFVRDKSNPLYLETSDTLRFTDGVFHTRIIKPR